MPSSTASCTQRTASPSTARPCANHQKNPPSVASLTPTTPSEPLKPSMGAAVRDHRNAVRDRSESLSAIDRNHCPHSPESAVGILNPIRAVVGIHNHRFNLFVKRSSTIRSANAALCLAQKRQRYCASAAAPFLRGE